MQKLLKNLDKLHEYQQQCIEWQLAELKGIIMQLKEKFTDVIEKQRIVIQNQQKENEA